MNARSNAPALAIIGAALILAVLILAPLLAGVLHASHAAGGAL